MSEFFKAELKDKFLQYASDRDDYFEIQLLYDEFLRPNYSIEFVVNVIREIIEHRPDLLDIMSGNGMKIFMLSSTAYTREFLEEGGFKDLYVEEEEKWDVFLEQLGNTHRLSQQEKYDLGKKDRDSYKRERILLYSLILAIAISFLFTMYNLIRPLFVEEESKKVEDLEKRVEMLENENQRLRKNQDTLQYPAMENGIKPTK